MKGYTLSGYKIKRMPLFSLLMEVLSNACNQSYSLRSVCQSKLIEDSLNLSKGAIEEALRP